jgi:prepilin peptidase CpaA
MFGIALSGSESSPLTIAWCIVLLVSITGAIWDVRTGRIPNALTMPVFLAGLLWSAYAGGVAGFSGSLGGAMLLALPCLFLFLFAGGGAGDVKLLGALGAWLSIHDAVVALGCVAAAGVVCGVVTTLVRRRSAMLYANLSRMAGSFAFAFASRRTRDATVLMPSEGQMQPMPYGIAIALGVWVAAGGRWIWGW